MDLPVPRWQRVVLPTLAALVLVAIAGCGGGSGGAQPSLSARPSVTTSRTASVPSPTRSEIDRTSADETTEAPTTAEPTPAPAETTSNGDSTARWPLFVALAILAAALGGVIVMVRRRSARRDWTASLTAVRAESAALARDLAPSLLAGTRESRRGGWEVARPSVVALEDQLTALARSAHRVPDSTVASELAAAVGEVRRTIDEEVRAPGDQSAAALWAAHDATQRLEARLQVLAPPA
jgi:hypothetical protein